MNAPRFSIVMLLPEARGIAEQSVRSWTSEQDFARERVELIVVSNGSEPDVEVRIPPLLGTSDRLLLHPGATRTELYDYGVRAARGEFVIFTESHCLAESSFLGAMDRYLQSTGLAAACCRTQPLCNSALSRIEAKCCAEGLEHYHQPDDWRKFSIHAFALRREVYLEVGGMNPRYGIFAEMILAAELWYRGYRAGLADAPPVKHLFDGQPREVKEYNRDVIAGEMRYYRDHPRGPRIDHTYLADGDVPWSERELAWVAFAALWSERQRGYSPALRQGWHALKLAASERRVGRVVDRATISLAATACRVIGSESALAKRLFLRSWTAAARLARKEFLAIEPPEEILTSETGSFRIDEIPGRDVWGFHLPEHWQGQPMRWTGRCAVMRLPRPVGACELILHTRGVGWPVAERKCSVHVDGRRLPSEAVSVEPAGIRLRIEPEAKRGAMMLAVVCDPVPPEQRGAEPRELGFPLFGIETRALGAVSLRSAA